MIIEYIFGPSVFITEEYPDTSLVYVPGTGESNVYIESIWVASDSGGGVSDHGALTGLSDDDHTQYLTQARGDARYYTESETDTLLAGKANTSHTHIIGDVTGLQTALDGKAATIHTHSISDVTNLQTQLDGKAASSHTHIIGDVTGLQTALDGKAATSHSHVIADVTGLQTALDGKQAAGSYAAASHIHIISDVTGLQTALDGKSNVGHTHPQSDITNLVSDLAGKAATVHTHAIADVTGLTSALYADQATLILQSLGAAIICESMGRTRSDAVQNNALVDGTAYYIAVYIPFAQNVTGVGWIQSVQGNYTADNNNVVGLYTYSAGTITRVAISANDGNLWKGASNTIQKRAFTSTYSASAGIHFIGFIYNSSAQVTAPSIAAYNNQINSVAFNNDFVSSMKASGTVATQTNIATSVTGAGLTQNAQQMYVFLY